MYKILKKLKWGLKILYKSITLALKKGAGLVKSRTLHFSKVKLSAKLQSELKKLWRHFSLYLYSDI